jgi:PAS domain S-box-containing protein
MSDEDQRSSTPRQGHSPSIEPATDRRLEDLAAELQASKSELAETREKLRTALAASHETESRLRDSEERFARFMENVPGLSWIKDLEGRYVYANKAAEQAFQSSRAALYGKTDLEIFPGDTAKQFSENDRRALETGAGIQTIETLRQEDGVHHSIVCKFPIRGTDGKVAMVGGVAIDISEWRRLEQELSDFFENASIASHWVGPDGIIQRANRAELEMLGYRREEYVGRHIADFHVDSAAIDDMLARLARGETLENYPARLRRKDGSICDVLVSSNVLFEDGKFIHTRSFTRDVTELKQIEDALRESEERFRTLADSSPALIWVNGLEGCEFVNRAYLDFLGVKSADVERFDWAKFVHPKDRDRIVNDYLAAFEGRKPYVVQHRFLRADGEYRWMKTVGIARLSPTGGFQGYAGSTLDITDIKEAEAALRDADRRKDEFLAVLGHELRNPLAAISTGITLLQSGPAPERRAWVEQMIARQVKQLERLVDDLLDVSRITLGKIELRKERVGLREILVESVASVEDLITQQRHQLSLAELSPEIYLQADPARLEQMLVNLLTNAAKYTPEGGRIWLSATQANETVAIRCRDTGVGLSPQEIEAIFEPFVQLGSRAGRPASGLGMGLTLVRELAQMHGGTATASSPGPGQGSEFVLSLPALTPDAAEPPTSMDQAVGPAAASRSRKVLVVDDNRDLAESLALFLRAAGHDVSVAYDGETAIPLAAKEKPDTVLLDIGLPGMDGFAVAERLRAEPSLKHTVIVAVSGRKLKEEAEEGVFDAQLVKPVGHQQLSALLQAKMAGTEKE